MHAALILLSVKTVINTVNLFLSLTSKRIKQIKTLINMIFPVKKADEHDGCLIKKLKDLDKRLSTFNINNITHYIKSVIQYVLHLITSTLLKHLAKMRKKAIMHVKNIYFDRTDRPVDTM